MQTWEICQQARIQSNIDENKAVRKLIVVFSVIATLHSSFQEKKTKQNKQKTIIWKLQSPQMMCYQLI